jgi:hypothetical protein
MYDLINAEATYRRQQVAKDWRLSNGERTSQRRRRGRRDLPDPAQRRRVPVVYPNHGA